MGKDNRFGRMGCLVYLCWCLVIFLPINPESKVIVKRSAGPLVRPRIPDQFQQLVDYKSRTKYTKRRKQKCKVVPLKARNHIKADTIFTGVVLSFHTQLDKYPKQIDRSYLKKGIPYPHLYAYVPIIICILNHTIQS